MSRLINNAFIKESYTNGPRINYSFIAAVLDTLKLTQYKYKREDVAALYRFIASVIEDKSFPWPGTFDLKPEQKNDKIETKEAEKPIASVSEDTTSKKVRKGTAKPKANEEASQSEEYVMA